jgi:hypothetical protein
MKRLRVLLCDNRITLIHNGKPRGLSADGVEGALSKYAIGMTKPAFHKMLESGQFRSDTAATFDAGLAHGPIRDQSRFAENPLTAAVPRVRRADVAGSSYTFQA